MAVYSQAPHNAKRIDLYLQAFLLSSSIPTRAELSELHSLHLPTSGVPGLLPA
jgi:hypothetical protein